MLCMEQDSQQDQKNDEISLFCQCTSNKITSFFYKTNLIDMETWYKLFTKKVLNNIKLTIREFEFDQKLNQKSF